MIRVNLGRSWEVQVIKNNGFEWVPAWKVDQIWEHKKERKLTQKLTPVQARSAESNALSKFNLFSFSSMFVDLSIVSLVEQNAC